MKTNSIFLAAIFLLLVATCVPATVLYVDLSCTNATPPYADWPTAATNIQDAIDASTNGDLILVTNGVYSSGSRILGDGTTNRVAVTKAVTLQSVSGPAATAIDGGNTMRCVYLTNGTVLAGFTITNGSISGTGFRGQGGGVYCLSRTAFVLNGVLRNNIATSANFAGPFGGGIFQGTLSNCTLIQNSAKSGGGGAYDSYLNNCMVVSNIVISGDGGGTKHCYLV